MSGDMGFMELKKGLKGCKLSPVNFPLKKRKLVNFLGKTDVNHVNLKKWECLRESLRWKAIKIKGFIVNVNHVNQLLLKNKNIELKG